MRKAVGSALAVATALAVVLLLLPMMGTDLSAQVAHADFFGHFGSVPIDLRWYGGTDQFGYSLISPAVMSVIGARWLGVISAVVAAGAFAYVLVRAGARRAVLGSVVGAICLVGNVASGRVTFALGVAFAMLALAVIAADRWPRWVRIAVVVVLGVLATLASPVAGLFAGIAAGALLVGGARRTPVVSVLAGSTTADAAAVGSTSAVAPGVWWWGRDAGVALALGVGAALGLVATLIFGDGGQQLYSADAMRTNVALAVVVIVLVPSRTIRAGAGLAIVMLIVAYYVPSAIGSNAIRLTMLFALPVIVAFATMSRWVLIAVIIGLVWWQSPVMTGDIAQAGAAETKSAFYQPLLAELGTLGPIGRIEVVPLRDHWESSFVADAVPLARGWERQVDVARNPLFYQATLTATSYRTWLQANAVSYVAIAPGQPLDVYGRTEAAVVEQPPSFLRPVWHNQNWQLYAVDAAQPLVAPGTLVSSGADRVIFRAVAPGDVTIRVRWSRWLTISGSDGGACVAAGPGGWTIARLPSPGTYTLTSSVFGARQC